MCKKHWYFNILLNLHNDWNNHWLCFLKIFLSMYFSYLY
nr:MAG TPA: hypothetical protein [Caudoviricetes sp.]